GFTETDAGILDLTVSDTSSDQVVTGLGIGVGFDRTIGTTQVSLEGRLAWERIFGDRSITTLSAIPIADATFATSSARAARDRLAVGLGAIFAIADDTSAEFRYDGSFAGSDSDHAGSLSLTMRF
ncbi:MAG: autotransporter outer membrane beta-barrel domain-containing protein, partial [Pseudomonadota bacterium]